MMMMFCKQNSTNANNKYIRFTFGLVCVLVCVCVYHKHPKIKSLLGGCLGLVRSCAWWLCAYIAHTCVYIILYEWCCVCNIGGALSDGAPGGFVCSRSSIELAMNMNITVPLCTYYVYGVCVCVLVSLPLRVCFCSIYTIYHINYIDMNGGGVQLYENGFMCYTWNVMYSACV